MEVFCFDDPTHNASEDVDAKPFLVMELPLGAFRCSVHHDERSRIHTSSSPSGAPFRPNPMLSIVAVRFAIYPTGTELANALLLVPRATFYEQIEAARESSDSEPEHRVFWHEWGPTGGLLLNLSGPEIIPRVMCSACGSRFVVLVRDKWKSGQAQVVVFDVNPWAAREAKNGVNGNARAGGSLTAIKDTSSYRFRTLRASVPHVAYLGPRLSFPKEHKPTFVTMNHDGFTVQVNASHIRKKKKLSIVSYSTNGSLRTKRGLDSDIKPSSFDCRRCRPITPKCSRFVSIPLI